MSWFLPASFLSVFRARGVARLEHRDQADRSWYENETRMRKYRRYRRGRNRMANASRKANR